GGTALLGYEEAVELNVSNNDIVVTAHYYDTDPGSGYNFKGISYAADYSATYTDRSLVDKAYVDSVAGGGTSYTFGSGLTETGGAVVLGGTAFAGDTTISGDFYDLTFLDLTNVNITSQEFNVTCTELN